MKLPYTPEELKNNERIARTYQSEFSKEFNKMQRDLTDKIWFMQEALRALPAHLRAHAETIDDTPPPENRPMPMWETPPIKGFNVQDYLQKEKTQEEEILEALDKAARQ
jgi:hypothetical protein